MGWMKLEYKWNDIYGYKDDSKEVKNDYKKNLAENMEFYRNIEKECETIDSCVKHALEHGNHAAFAKYYLESACSTYDMLKARFYEFLSERQLTNYKNAYRNFRKEYLENWEILKPDYWNSYEKGFEGEFYGSGAKEKWMEFEHIPSREAIIQLAFYMNLTLAETNQFLMSAGHEVLYVLNLLDAVCMFYLNYYQLEENKAIQGRERLTNVKEMVCQYAKLKKDADTENSDENTLYIEKMSFKGKTSKKKAKSDKLLVMLPNAIAYGVPIGNDIDERIEQMRGKFAELGEEIPNNPYMEDEFFLTHLYKDKVLEYKNCEDFEDFIKKNIFDFLPYGYLKKRNHVMKKDSYCKNLYKVMYPLDLTASIKKIESCIRNKQHNLTRDNFYNNKKERELYDKMEQALFSGLKEEEYIIIMNGLWNRRDLEGDTRIEKLQERNRVRNYFYGRNTIASDKNQYRAKNENVKAAFQFTVGDKLSYMKLCIAMGEEDNLDRFMALGNYWTEEYWKQADKSKLEYSEALYYYAIQYKDCLIDAWVEAWKKENSISGRNDKEFRKKISDNFPFIHLLMLICRDIQFVMSVTKAENAKNMLKALTYPIGRIDNRRCGGFEQENEDERKVYCWYRDYCKWKKDNAKW